MQQRRQSRDGGDDVRDDRPVIHHLSGLTLMPPADPTPKPMPEDLAVAWSDAFRAAQQHPDDLGYPWADTARSRLVVTQVTARGAQLASTLDSSARSKVARTTRTDIGTFA